MYLYLGLYLHYVIANGGREGGVPDFDYVCSLTEPTSSEAMIMLEDMGEGCFSVFNNVIILS